MSLIFSLSCAAYAENWHFSGGDYSGDAEIRTFYSVRMTSVDDIARGMGFKMSSSKGELLIHAPRGLKFVSGAAMVWIGYNVTALPACTRFAHSKWWAPADSVLEVFSQFLRANGRRVDLKWMGRGSDVKKEPVKKQTPPEKKKNLNPVQSPFPPVEAVRWGNNEGVIRAVVDLKGSMPPIWSRNGDMVTVQVKPMGAAHGRNLAGSKGGVKLVVNPDTGKLKFFCAGKNENVFILKDPYRLVLDFAPGQKNVKKQAPAPNPKPKLKPKPVPRPKTEPKPVPKPVKKITPHKKSSGSKLVVIDPGHGGKDPGAPGCGYHEKTLALQISLKLRDSLVKRGIRVKMTRTGDTYPTLRQRTEMANKWNADVFVSIHLNALPRGRHARGMEIYFMSLPSDKDAATLAMIENAVFDKEMTKLAKTDKKTGRLYSIIGDMQQNAKISESTVLAEDLFAAGKRGGLHMRRVAQAPFWVLRGCAMPAVLIETGFITERADVKLLTNRTYQKKMADSIASGIVKFLKN